MRLGCFGCLAVLVVLMVIVMAALGLIFMSGNITSAPDTQPTRYSRADGLAAQQKLYEVVLRQSGRSSRQDPVVITEQEANAFLANHLAEAAGLPFNPIMVRFATGQLEMQGQTPLRNLLQGPPFAQLLPYISDSRLDHPIWVTIRGRIILEPKGVRGDRTYGRIELSNFQLGKQELGGWLLSLMLGPTSQRIMRWQVPAVVQEIEVQPGKLVIATR
jgi:hypothetical protein